MLCLDEGTYAFTIQVGMDLPVAVWVPYYYIPEASGTASFNAMMEPAEIPIEPPSVALGEHCRIFTIGAPAGAEYVRIQPDAAVMFEHGPRLLTPCGPDRIPTPLKQAQTGVQAANIDCLPDRVLVESSRGQPACVSAGSAERLVERGWAVKHYPEPATPDHSYRCLTGEAIEAKFDSGLLDRILEMLDAGIARPYSVILAVDGSDKKSVEGMLRQCHGATDVRQADALPFVTASPPCLDSRHLCLQGDILNRGRGALRFPSAFPKPKGHPGSR